MPKIYRVSNVEEAIELAIGFRDERKYDWFRGQTQIWPPYSSLARLQLTIGDNWESEYMPRLVRFIDWLKSTPELGAISENTDSIFSIAQHYGIPTHYVDFTTDPAVAGYFSADTKSPCEGEDACIYCLNTGDLLSVWKCVQEVRSDLNDIQLITNTVPDLWRLEAQSGVFLFCDGNWDVIYPMDRIVFPYSGYPAFPTRENIYPDRKSHLEILLDRFFDSERKIESGKVLNEMLDDLANRGTVIPCQYWTSFPSNFYSPAFKDSQLTEHLSWQVASKWRLLSGQAFGEVFRREATLSINFEVPSADLRKTVMLGVRRALERDSTLRQHAVRWNLQTATLSKPVELPVGLAEGMDRIWDGMRGLPCENQDIANALGLWVALAQMGYANEFIEATARDMVSQLIGPCIRVEFAAPDGSSSRGFASRGSLLQAVRSDIGDLLESGSFSIKDDLERLLLTCYSARRLFDFDKLLPVFLCEIVPTQMNRSPPHFFSPAHIEVLGLP